VSSSFNNQAESASYLHSDLTSRVNAAAIAVHRALGPGYLEAIYEEAVCVELERQKIAFERQRAVRVRYESVPVGLYRLDLVIEGKVVVEVKAVAAIDRAHLATMFSYLKATGLEVGLIVNFSSEVVRIRRVFRGSDRLNEGAEIPSA